MQPASFALEIQGLDKSFGQQAALKNLNLNLESGKVLALLGPSGCGKTTLLRCIAGLVEADAGRISVLNQTVFSPKKSLPPEQRHLGMVFQDYALWPHMTVGENVGFPLKMLNRSKQQVREKTAWALELVGLLAAIDKQPGALSGGQQQRVALARAIVSEPRLLLMDEPLSNLDKGLRESLAADIRQLIERLGLTAVFVTHDQMEAFALADEVAVLNQGHLQQLASPEELFLHPATPEIAEFVDSGSLLNAHLAEQTLHFGGQSFALEPLDYSGPIQLLIPRQAIRCVDKGSSLLGAKVVRCSFQGDYYSMNLLLEDGQSVRFRSPVKYSINQVLGLDLNVQDLSAWSMNGEKILLSLLESPSNASLHTSSGVFR